MFGEINAIRALATKYSKPQLANLVQTGQLEPQKAVLAGMMIDRIAKSAMEPPQTTVAQDVLGQAPTAAQGQMPQDEMPQDEMAEAPQMPPAMAAGGGLMGIMPHSDGVTALHSGLHDMAGGGIVAFAGGGDIPRYADGKLTDSRNDPAMRIDPEIQRKRDKDWRLATLLQELKEEQAKGNEANVAAIKREIRAIKPSLSADAGIAALIPSAQAAEPQRSPSGPAMLKAEAAKSAPVVEEEASYDPMTGLKISGPEPKPYSPTVKPGTIYEPNIIRNMLQGAPRVETPQAALPPIAKPSTVKPIETTPNLLKPDVAPDKTSMGPATPTSLDQLGNFYGASMQEPKERSLQDVMKDQAEADKAYGVDTKKMFDDLRQDYKNSSGNLKQRADKAAGMALMMFGAGLVGARQGRVGEAVSKSGQQALGVYMNSMDKINDNEDKLKQRMQDLSIAENQFNRGRSDKALAEIQSSKKDIQAIRLENAKLENQALIKAAEYRVDIFKTENPPQYTLLKNIAIESNKTPAEIFMIANGIQKTGGMTLNQALEAVQRNPKYLNKSFAEQMQVAKEGIGEGGGGLPKPKTAADADKLPKGTQYQAPDGSIRTKQ
jgi:hypothetical protein